MFNFSKKSPYTRGRKSSGITLIEVLISVAILAILINVVLTTGFKSYIQKARDSKRKQDLNKLVRILEDYYNDYGRYPPPNEYFSGTIAGNPWGSSFPSYLSPLPKDPLSPGQEYFYHGDTALGRFFAIFAKLENREDPDIVAVGCPNGCGPDLAYNYVVHSPNVVMLAGLPNGEAVPGGTSPTPEGGGGGGGGGGGEPSPTAGPSPTLGPSPTSPPPPLPTNVPGTKGHGEFCVGPCPCGAYPPFCPAGPGIECLNEWCCANLYGPGGCLWKCNFILNPCLF